MKLNSKLYKSLLGIGIILSSTSSFAATAKGTMKSTAKMEKSCTILGENVNFGSVSFSNVKILSKWNHILVEKMDVQVKCNKGVAYTVVNKQIGSPADNGLPCAPTVMCMSGKKPENKDTIAFGVYRSSNLNDGWVGDGKYYGPYLSTIYNARATGRVDVIPHYFTVYNRGWPRPDEYSFQYKLEIEY